MHLSSLFFGPLLVAINSATAGLCTCVPFPDTITPFSSSFQQPDPPMIEPEFTANFVQHKWNQNLSHITTGFVSNSPSEGIVQVEEAFDGQLASSLFDYANVTQDGLVANTLTTYTPPATQPDIWQGYVNPAFPLFGEDILVQNTAVFSGLVSRPFLTEKVAAWDIMYQDAIPVTVYVDACNIVVGYDFFAMDLRTRVITEYFNIQAPG